MAARNAQRYRLNLEIIESDLFAGVPSVPRYDIIVSNPPYVPDGQWESLSSVITKHEDPSALLAGPDGLDCIRKIVTEASGYLKPGGLLALEMGEEQGEAVSALFRKAGFDGVCVAKDLAGHDRIVRGTNPFDTG